MTQVILENGRLSYSKYVGGNEILIAFHGFGQNKEKFNSWTDQLIHQFTIYTFDIFYHGDSERQYGELSKKEWKQYLITFFKKENIQHFNVLGFSLGGRFAIATSLLFPKMTKRLILLAPDGMFRTIWFKLATHPASRWLFKYFMLRPDKLDILVTINKKYKFTNPYLNEFVAKELGANQSRKRIYISWNHFKTLGYSKRDLIDQLRKHTFVKQIILGSKDHIIKPDKILPIIEEIGGFRVDILPLKHHQLIKPEVAKLILK